MSVSEISRPLMLFCWSAVIFGSAAVAADRIMIEPHDDLRIVLERIAAGDTIVLRNGVWTDVNLKFEKLNGTRGLPIRIQAETPGQVILTGTSQFRFSGTHIEVSGLVFRDISGVSDVVQFRSHSQRTATDCRLTECSFEQTSDESGNSRQEARWVSVYGKGNRIDHCFFGGKQTAGSTLVVWVTDEPGSHRIDHNHFGHRPELGRNGGETIRIGTSHVSEHTSGTVVEDNYFHRCNGEAEIISNKSCGNTYRRNVFDECSGALTLRHGHRCTVDANVFLGRQQRGTGGIRIIGTDHVITNNYFEGLRGDAERAALSLMNGIKDGPLNGYAPVRRAVISHNTFADCKVTLEIGVGAGTTQSEAPADCRITHNVLLPGNRALLRVHADPIRFHWAANLLQTGAAEVPLPIEAAAVSPFSRRCANGLLRPDDRAMVLVPIASAVRTDIDGEPRRSPDIAGCDDPDTDVRILMNSGSTGPGWRR